MKMQKLFLAMFATATFAGLSGCFDSSSSSNDTTADSGTAVDWYIAGATVFADFNKDGIYNGDDVKTTTDANGKYTLNLPSALAAGDYQIVLKGGTDTATNLPFNGVLTAPKGRRVVSPVTTLVQAVGDEVVVSNFLSLSPDADLYADPVPNKDLFIASQKLVTFLGAVAKVASKATDTGVYDGTAVEEVYNFGKATQYLADAITAANEASAPIDMSSNTYVTDTIKNLVTDLGQDNTFQSTLLTTNDVDTAIANAVTDIDTVLTASYPDSGVTDGTVPQVIVPSLETAMSVEPTVTVTPVVVTITVDEVDQALTGTTGAES